MAEEEKKMEEEMKEMEKPLEEQMKDAADIAN